MNRTQEINRKNREKLWRKLLEKKERLNKVKLKSIIYNYLSFREMDSGQEILLGTEYFYFLNRFHLIFSF